MNKKYLCLVGMVLSYVLSFTWILPALISAKDNLAVIVGFMWIAFLLWVTIIGGRFLLKEEK